MKIKTLTITTKEEIEEEDIINSLEYCFNEQEERKRIKDWLDNLS